MPESWRLCRQAIASARPLQSSAGSITREDLEQLGLVANFGQGGTEVHLQCCISLCCL